MVTKKRCARLKMTEFDEAFNDELENSEVMRTIQFRNSSYYVKL